MIQNVVQDTSDFKLLCLNHVRQKWLAVVSLETSNSAKEHKPLRKLGRSNKYEIKGVLWSPHKAKHGLVASTVRPQISRYIKVAVQKKLSREEKMTNQVLLCYIDYL